MFGYIRRVGMGQEFNTQDQGGSEMKIELGGDWVAGCEVEVKFKGHTLTGYWSVENGYRIVDWGDLDMSDDDRDEMERLLQDAETPVIRFKNGTYETEV